MKNANKARSIKKNLLAMILCIAFGFSVILFSASMVILIGQEKQITRVSTETADNISGQAQDSLETLEKNMSDDIADASLAYFGKRFDTVQKHAEAIARKAGALYAANVPMAQMDEFVGMIGGVSAADVADEFAVIAPIRDMIAYLPDYDVNDLKTLDLYIMTESGMCLDGTWYPLGENYADLRQENWYQMAKETGKTYWTGIFTGKVTGSVKVVCSVPFYDGEGRFMGVASGDVAVDTFKSIIDSFGVQEVESILFYDRDGGLMYATNNGIDTDQTRKYLELGQNYVATQDQIFSYRQMENTGWTLCFILNKDAIKRTVGEITTSIQSNTAFIQDTITGSINRSILIFILLLAAGGILVVCLTNMMSNRVIIKPLRELNDKAGIIGGGNLDVVIPATRNDEIGHLSGTFNQMAKDLKQYMTDFAAATREKERIASELNVATQIQADMLPSLFPAFPDKTEFDLYASMNPAKEVGGDFYDFFMVDDTHLAMVIADVSGKGVPAALFMVIAKTLLKNRAEMGGSPAQVLCDVNNQLCDGNKSQLFVTVWMAILDITTGQGFAVNAGHEHPAVCKQGEKFELIKYKHMPALATMEDLPYRQHEFTLQPGDTLFVYTDGVPEATNGNEELFGDERMLEALNKHRDESLESLLTAMRREVDLFVGDAPQFDDLTMLVLRYYGEKN